MNIILLALPSWEEDDTPPTVALASVWATLGHRVLYVEHPPTQRPIRSSAHRSWYSQIRDVPVSMNGKTGRVHVLTPRTVRPAHRLPGPLHETTRAVNIRSLQSDIEPALWQYDMQQPVVVSTGTPHYAVPLADAFGAPLTVHYAYDDLDAPDSHPAPPVQEENAALFRVGLVVASCSERAGCHMWHHPNVHCIPNGVDMARFGVDPSHPRPPRQRPCIGYVGRLDDRLDYACLHRLAETRPDWDLRLVGSVTDARADALARHPNVVLTGPQPPDALPSEIKRMDAGLLPFAPGAFTFCTHPMEVAPYLAACLPIIATASAGPVGLDPAVSMAPANEEIARVIEAELTSDSLEKRRHRFALAQRRSWMRRGEDFLDLIRRYQLRAV
jgi:glycosyltransferase involved in cell wall biosynthesis